MVLAIVLSTAIVMIAWERYASGRAWPRVTGWWPRALALNSLQVGSVILATYTWDRWMPGAQLWSADRLGLWGGTILGYFTITFVYYWWHRLRHESVWFWRWFHQVHHSPKRIEVITSFYKHPFELVANGVLSSAILYLGVGLKPQEATLAILLTGLAELFYHWNVRTPYWLGFLIQRPESHCVHHQTGLHHYNYADLPLWDILFGTFHNPKQWENRCGFKGDREKQLGAMLLGKDVNR